MCLPNFSLARSKINVPNSTISFSTRVMHIFHPFHWFANSTAFPIEWCHAYIPRSCLPFAIYHTKPNQINHEFNKETWWIDTFFIIKHIWSYKAHYDTMLKLRTWRCPTAHGMLIYVFNFQSDEPGAQWHVLICISMQYGPAPNF